MRKILTILTISILLGAFIYAQEGEVELEIDTMTMDEMTVAYYLNYGPFDLIEEKMGGLFQWVDEMDFETVGPPGAIYYTQPNVYSTDEHLWELFVPIVGDDVEVFSEGDMGVRVISSKDVVVAVYEGPYEEMAPVYTEIYRWGGEKKLMLVGDPIEIYLNDPAEVEPEELLTEIRIPFFTPAKSTDLAD